MTLRMFTPHINKGHFSLDSLDLFTVPARPNLVIPAPLIMELLLFSGQLYLNSYTQYLRACAFLDLAWKPVEGDEVLAPDGFIRYDSQERPGGPSGFTRSPVSFLKSLMTLRRDAQSIDRRCIRDMLDNKLLFPEDFDDGDGTHEKKAHDVHETVKGNCDVAVSEDVTQNVAKEGEKGQTRRAEAPESGACGVGKDHKVKKRKREALEDEDSLPGGVKKMKG